MHILGLSIVMMFLSAVSTYAASLSFSYSSWNTSGYGELSGIEEDGTVRLTEGFIDDTRFGRLELFESSSRSGYLESPNDVFHYNNLIFPDDNLIVDNWGLLFTNNDYTRQLNLWGIDFSFAGLSLGPLYTICVSDDQRYIWSSFVVFSYERSSTTPIPEPTTMLLFGIGITGLAASVRNRRIV